MGFFSSDEETGTAALQHTANGWNVHAETHSRTLSVAFLHYLDRVLQGCGTEYAVLFLQRICRAMEEVLQSSTSEMLAKNFGAMNLLDATFNPLAIQEPTERTFTLRLLRKKDKLSPGGHLYYVKMSGVRFFENHTSIANLALESAKALYQHLYRGDDTDLRLFLFRGLQFQVLLYGPDHLGPPSLRTIGKAPTLAQWMAFGFPIVEGITAEDAANGFNAYLQGSHPSMWD